MGKKNPKALLFIDYFLQNFSFSLIHITRFILAAIMEKKIGDGGSVYLYKVSS